MADARDYAYMARALRLARKGLYTTHPNPRVGCLLVRDDDIVGEGWHVHAGQHHAEINALHIAGERARGATAYVTLEPCCHHGRTPPCTEALLAAGVTRVVAAMQDPNPRVAGKGMTQLAAAGITVETGVMAKQARALNPGFIQRMSTARPWVRCKLAMSLDGRTALASGESRWITGESARLDVQRLRACSSAIMTSVATVIADDPSLNVRLTGEPLLQPLRVILDSALKTPSWARTLSLDGKVLILTTVTNEVCYAPLKAVGAEIAVLPGTDAGLDLTAVMAELASREINEVHVECGAKLAGALLRAGLLDELIIYLAPLVLGDSARGLFHLPELASIGEGFALEITDIRAVGRDWRISARPRL